MKARRYDEAVAECRQRLLENPEDWGAIELMARAFRAVGRYDDALPMFMRLEAHHKEDPVANAIAPGTAAWRIEIASVHWLLGRSLEATSQMHGLAAGILDGSIQYGDAAGGMQQGLLLYYMAVTAGIPGEASYALDYLRNRVERLRKRVGEYLSRSWPCPVAQYLLGDVAFESVLEEVDRRPKLNVPDAETRIEIGRRYMLQKARFYDGVKSRASGDEARCLARMRECYEIESPSWEWDMARSEVLRADALTNTKERPI